MSVLASAMFLTALASGPQFEASDCGVVQTQPVQTPYASIEMAVRAQARVRLDDSVSLDREWVGGVLRGPDGRYRVTEGVGCPGQDTVTFAVSVTQGSQIVAFWHTHGGHGFERDKFSPDDARLVVATGRDFFLMTPDGALKVLRPQDARRPAAEYAGAAVRNGRGDA